MFSSHSPGSQPSLLERSRPSGLPRTLAAVAGYVALFFSLPIGIIAGFLFVLYFGLGSVPRIVIVVPALPLVCIAWLLLRAGGQTESEKVGLGIKAILFGGVVAAVAVFAWLFS